MLLKTFQNNLSKLNLVSKKISEINKNEWDRIIYLSKQTRHYIREIDDQNLSKIYYGKYSDVCKNYQLYYGDKMIANCFVDRVNLYNDEFSITTNYLTGLNRDLDSEYKGIGNLFLKIMLYNYKLIYLKPANKPLEDMYINLGFFATNLKGIGNCRFPIYTKYSDSDFPKNEFNEKFILK